MLPMFCLMFSSPYWMSADNRMSASCPRTFSMVTVFLGFWVQAFGLETSQSLRSRRLQLGCVPAMAQALLFLCKWCGLQFEASQGRSHGKVFECTTCTSADRMIRRNLGEKPSELANFTPEEQNDFYQRLHREKKENPNSRLMWQTVRVSLVTCLTTRQISRHESKVKAKFLPLSVYVAQGWSADVVQQCEKQWSDELSCDTYRVPVKQDTFSDVFERVSERLLQQEKQAAGQVKTKGAKTEEDALDVPAAPKKQKGDPKERTEEQEARLRVKQEKKNQSKNTKTNLVAAKNVGMLTQAFTSLAKMRARVPPESLDEGTRTTVQDCETKLCDWVTQAKACLAKADTNAVKEGSEELPELPFDRDSVKAILKQAGVVVASLKTFLPAPKAKAKAGAKAGASKRKRGEAEEEKEESAGPVAAVAPVSRRRTGKSS